MNERIYTEHVKEVLIEEFKNSKKFPYDFAKSHGILISEFRRWLREDNERQSQKKSKLSQNEFGIININLTEEPEKENVTNITTKGTTCFKFENSTMKIELQSGYDKKILQKIMEVLVID